MFIAHLPAGYITSRYYCQFLAANHAPGNSRNIIMAVGMLGSIMPDLDLFYFYIIDNRQHSHHSYITHTPILWLLTFSLIFVLGKLKNLILLQQLNIIFHINIAIHLLLDTFVGGIKWLYPLSNHYSQWFNIPSEYQWWVWNFILHWSFFAELAIVALAAYLFIYSIK